MLCSTEAHRTTTQQFPFDLTESKFSGDITITDDFAEVMDMIMTKQAQFLQKMVKEIDTMKLAVIQGG